mgnify:CR=1 FL=1
MEELLIARMWYITRMRKIHIGKKNSGDKIKDRITIQVT